MELPGPDYPAPAKLNLFLHVVGRRNDGYHLLQSVFTLIDRGDRLRFRVRADGVVRRLNDVPGIAPDDDLAESRRPASCKRRAEPRTVPISSQISAFRWVAVRGGSSDAATALLALNHLWQTGMSREALTELGARLGADVPFFVFGRSAWVEGIGERLRAVDAPSRGTRS